MASNDSTDPNALMRRSVKRLLITIAIAVACMLGLTLWLWWHSPQPP